MFRLVFLIFISWIALAQKVKLPTAVQKTKEAIYQIKTDTSRGTAFFIQPDLAVAHFETVVNISDVNEIILSRPKSSNIRVEKIVSASFHGNIVFLKTKKKVKYFIKKGQVLDSGYIYSIGYSPGGELLQVKSSNESSKIERAFSAYRIFFDYSKDFRVVVGAPVLNSKGEYVGMNYDSADSVLYYTSAYHMSRVSPNSKNNLGTVCDDSLNCLKKENSRLNQHMGRYLSRDGTSLSYKSFHLRTTLQRVMQTDKKDLVLKYLKKGARDKSVEAAFTLGMFYLKGIGFSQNFKRSMRFFQQAANSGHTEAQYVLGILLLKGKGSTQNSRNDRKAFEWMFRSAQGGLLEAQWNLALFLAEGIGISKAAPHQAREWFETASHQGHPKAQFMLGQAYLDGEGILQDNEKGVYWIKKSAEGGDTKAQMKLASLYLFGVNGISRNIREAQKHLRRAAKNNNAEAQFKLGVIAQSQGKPARRFFEKAAMNGHLASQIKLQSLGTSCETAMKSLTE